MDFKDLTPEQQEMARACKTQEELAELAKSFGIELSDEELAAVAGGLVSDCIRNRTCLREIIGDCSVKNICPSLLPCVTEACLDVGPCNGYMIECKEFGYVMPTQ